MAVDFEKVLKRFMNDDGGIPADSVQTMLQAFTKAVGENFVTVERYNAKKAVADELQTKLDAAGDAQTKYDKLKADFDKFKVEQDAKQVRADKETAYKAILTEMGVPEKRHAAILRTVDFDKLNLAKDGKGGFEDAEAVKKTAQDDWGDFVGKPSGIPTANPPRDNGSKPTKTKDEIMAIKDAGERQRAIAENHELFGF